MKPSSTILSNRSGKKPVSTAWVSMEAGFMKALANTYQKKKPSGKYSAATTIRSRTGLPDSFSPADISCVWVCGFTSCCSSLLIAVALFQPQPGIVEHLHPRRRSEEHTSELQSRGHLVCRLLLEKKKKNITNT